MTEPQLTESDMSTIAETITMTPIPALALMSASQIVMQIRRARTAKSAASAIACSDRTIAAAKAVRT